jgi:hypothetical protein
MELGCATTATELLHDNRKALKDYNPTFVLENLNLSDLTPRNCLALRKGTFWPVGSTLRIRFLNGTEDQ